MKQAGNSIFEIAKRKAINISQENLVNVIYTEKGLVIIEPLVEGLELAAWASANRMMIDAYRLKYGAILFRNFYIKSTADFERMIEAVSDGWAQYREMATPRSHVGGNIYTSTDYPANQVIFLHNENSHCTSWPLKIFFLCLNPASHGGETPIANCRDVFNRLDLKVRNRFVEKKVMYVRNFGGHLGFSWQTVFQTTDKAAVEKYCKDNSMDATWSKHDRLRIRYVRPAVARHPETGEMVWFNHATFFHCSTLNAEVRRMLLTELSEEDLPYNTYYGDGSAIEPSVLDKLREVYEQATIIFQWQKGDVLMLDNMLMAHGRSSYEGSRKVVVGMAEPYFSENS